jgi:DNA-binding MarR family transcriptional regulator
MSSPPDRGQLVAELMAEFRKLSTATVLFHQAVADRLGLNVTDHKCAELLCRAGPVTAGDLARLTGLTTGAITGVIDRLERAGFVRRAKDPADRRRVVIEPDVKRLERVIGPLFESMGRASAELCSRYTTEQLAVIHDFTVRCQEMANDETQKMREAERPSRTGRGRATSG